MIKYLQILVNKIACINLRMFIYCITTEDVDMFCMISHLITKKCLFGSTYEFMCSNLRILRNVNP